VAIQDEISKIIENLGDIKTTPPFDLKLLLARSLIDALLPVFTPLGGVITDSLKGVANELKENLFEGIQGYIDAAKDAGDNLTWMSEEVKKATSDAQIDNIYKTIKGMPVLGYLYVLSRFFLTMVTLVLGELSSSRELTEQSIRKDRRPTLLDVNNIVEGWHRFPDLSASLKESLERYGFKDEDITTILDNSFSVLPLAVLRFNWLRELMSDEELTEGLSKLKISSVDQEYVKNSFAELPSVHDEVLFALREVYHQDIRDKYELDEDRPEEFVERCVKLGLSREDAEKFWAAHWKPPSVQQAITGLHRRKINEKDLNTLLRVNDIMPAFRQLIVDIAYTPLTRVDVRRVYKFTDFDYDDVYEAYLDLGYNEKNAKLLADFVSQEYSSEDRELTKSDILSLYSTKYYDENTTINMLQDIGYPEYDATLIVTNQDLKDERKRVNKLLTKYKNGFVAARYTKEQAESFLYGLGFDGYVIDDYIDDWQIEKDAKTTILSVSQIKKLLKSKLIDKKIALYKLGLRGYIPDDANLLLKLWEQE
jgi:hypothetical protein